MLTIRLKSEGKKHQKTMRIVVIDSRKSSISNKYIEKVGWWIPAEHKHDINKDRVLYWISKGAKPSITVYNLLVEDKIIEGNKIPKHNQPKKKAGEVTEKPVEEKKEVVKEAPVEEKKEEVIETPKEEVKETPTEEVKEETPEEDKKEESK